MQVYLFENLSQGILPKKTLALYIAAVKHYVCGISLVCYGIWELE